MKKIGGWKIQKVSESMNAYLSSEGAVSPKNEMMALCIILCIFGGYWAVLLVIFMSGEYKPVIRSDLDENENWHRSYVACCSRCWVPCVAWTKGTIISFFKRQRENNKSWWRQLVSRACWRHELTFFVENILLAPYKSVTLVSKIDPP